MIGRLMLVSFFFCVGPTSYVEGSGKLMGGGFRPQASFRRPTATILPAFRGGGAHPDDILADLSDSDDSEDEWFMGEGDEPTIDFMKESRGPLRALSRAVGRFIRALNQLWKFIASFWKNISSIQWSTWLYTPPYEHLAEEPNAEKAKEIMQRLKVEFDPIIKERRFHVVKVLEFTGDCDVDEEAGVVGELRGYNAEAVYTRVRQMNIHENRENEVGYMLATRTVGERQWTRHTIGLRLRIPDIFCNALFEFYSYEEICETMCHELAHCVHRNHGDAFYKLMEELQLEHKKVVSQMKSSRRKNGHAGRFMESKRKIKGKGRRLGDWNSSTSGDKRQSWGRL